MCFEEGRKEGGERGERRKRGKKEEGKRLEIRLASMKEHIFGRIENWDLLLVNHIRPNVADELIG